MGRLFYSFLIILSCISTSSFGDSVKNVPPENLVSNNSSFFTLPDLIVNNISISSSLISPNGLVTVMSNVQNQGSTAASSSSLGYYLSTDTIWDVADIYLGNDQVDTLGVNNIDIINNTLTIPNSTTTGNYYILFVADYLSNINESDENNNVSNSAIVVQLQPDLFVRNTTVSPSTVIEGNNVSVTSRVKNQGAASASASDMGYYLSTDSIWDVSDLYLEDDQIDPLSPGSQDYETANFTIPVNTPAGTNYILYVADYLSAITESNENNNVTYEPITVVPYKASLRTQANSTSLSVLATNVSVSMIVENIGVADAANFKVGYYLSIDGNITTSDYLIGTSVVTSLTAGGSTSESMTVNIATIPNVPSGTYYLGFIVDYENTIDELDETDNVTSWQTPQVTQPTSVAPDLIVQNMTSSLNVANVGVSVNITSEVYNMGTSTANVSNLGYFLSDDIVWDPTTDIYLGFDQVNSLAINTKDNEATSFIVPSGVVTGSYYILYIADYLQTVPESDETNNVGYLPIWINNNTGSGGNGGNKPNLQAKPGSEVLTLNGTDITIDLIVENIGTANAGMSYVGYYLSTDNNFTTSDILIGTDYVTSLATGDSSIEQFNLDISLVNTIPPGTYHIGFILDYQDVVNESDENDNYFHWIAPQVIQPVTLLPDLVEVNMSVSATSAYQGGTIDLAGKVKNIGTASTSAKTYLGYYLSTDTLFNPSFDTYLAEDQVRVLNINNTDSENARVTIPMSVTNGSYYIILVADHRQTLTELDELNNVSYQAITIDSTLGLPPFSWTPTNQSGVFLGQALLDSLPVDVNDWIAAIGPNGECAGAAQIVENSGSTYINLTIYGDDPLTTTVDEGIGAGEYFTLELYDESDNVYRKYPALISLYQFTQWTNTNGTVLPAYNSVDTIYNFMKEVDDVVTLKAGWNLISFDVEIPDSSITTVFSEVISDNNLEYVTGFNNGSTFFDPSSDPAFNTLTSMTRGYGYWVKVIADDTVTVRGVPLDENYGVDLNKNWNLVSYIPQTSESPETHYSRLIDSSSLLYVSGFDGGTNFFDPNGPTFVNTLTSLENGRGYWVKVDTAIARRNYKSGLISTPTNIYDFVNGVSNLTEPEHLGKEIIVRDEDGNEIEHLMIIQNGYVMTSPLYGDDLLTTDIDGIEIGEKLYFDYEGQILDLGVTFTGSMAIHQLNFQYDKSLFTGTNDMKVENVEMKCFPSPFTHKLFIDYNLPETADVSIKVYNAFGVLVEVQELGTQLEGNQRTMFIANETYPVGNYIISLEMNGQLIETKQVILLK